jgi:hypothetical protein
VRRGDQPGNFFSDRLFPAAFGAMKNVEGNLSGLGW